MNLAEIRKKAQRERQEQVPAVAGRVPVVPPEACLPLTVSSDVPARAESSFPGPEQFPETVEPFDPLGVILAGREAVRSTSLRDSVPESGPQEVLTGFLGFTVGGETYTVEIDRVREILRPRRVTPVPRAPASITGIISHRGAIIPVLDLPVRLGIAGGSPGGAKRIVVVRMKGSLCGLLVDGVGRVVMLSASSVEPVPAGPVAENREFVSGIARYRGAMLIFLNLDKVLDIGWRST